MDIDRRPWCILNRPPQNNTPLGALAAIMAAIPHPGARDVRARFGVHADAARAQA